LYFLSLLPDEEWVGMRRNVDAFFCFLFLKIKSTFYDIQVKEVILLARQCTEFWLWPLEHSPAHRKPTGSVLSKDQREHTYYYNGVPKVNFHVEIFPTLLDDIWSAESFNVSTS